MTNRDELLEAVKTIKNFCLSHSGSRGVLKCRSCGLHDFCEYAPVAQAYTRLVTFCTDLIGEINSERFLRDNPPFCLNGREVLCMSCKFRDEYHVVLDEFHHQDIFIAQCSKKGAFVGLPLDECDDYEKEASE